MAQSTSLQSRQHWRRDEGASIHFLFRVIKGKELAVFYFLFYFGDPSRANSKGQNGGG